MPRRCGRGSVGYRTIRRRHWFLTALGGLDDPLIRRLAGGVDGLDHIALVLIVLPPEGQEEPAGVAHLVPEPGDPATADIAITVADDRRWRVDFRRARLRPAVSSRLASGRETTPAW